MSVRAFKQLRPFLLFATLLFSTVSLAQNTCPTDLKRNNGNNAAHTTYAASVSGTVYTTVPSGNKEGKITLDFGSITSSQVPVLEGAYEGSTRLSVEFGPPSVPSNGVVEYCFYQNNLAPANAFTLRFLNPSDGSVRSLCTYPSIGSNGTNPISVSSNIADVTKCSGESVTWTVTAPSGSSYQWMKDGANISGATSASLALTSLATSDAGLYSCEVNYGSGNNAWTYNTASGALTVNSCSPSSLILTDITAAGAVSIDGSNNFSFTFAFEFNQSIGTPSTSDFEAFVDGTESRTITSVTAQSGSTTVYDVVVDLDENDEGILSIALKSSNSITSTTGSLTLSSTTPTGTDDHTFDLGGDGITASVEDAVANGDRNGDGKKDKHQKNVSTFPWKDKAKFNSGASAASSDFVTLSVGKLTGNTGKDLDKNLKITSVDVKETTDAYFNGIAFPTTLPNGLSVSPVYDPVYFKIEANGNSFSARDMDGTRTGTQIRVYFDMPDGGESFNTYMKWNSVDQEWYEFVADGDLSTFDDGAEFVDLDSDGDYDRIVLTITEGDKQVVMPMVFQITSFLIRVL